MNKYLSKIFSAVLFLLLMFSVFPIQTAQAVSPDIVISQVYGGGGNSGATYTNDFIELFNRGASPVSLAGWSVQYASATGTGNFGANSGQLTELPNISLAPGQYLLIEEAAGAGGTTALPSPDVADLTPINMSATSGKLALVNSTSSLGCNGGSNVCSPAQLAMIVDLVGYGDANFSEGTPAPTLTNSTAALRAKNGCTDTDDNSADFTADSPNPRNTGSPMLPCGGSGASGVIITEIMYDPNSAEDNWEWIEIYNAGAASVNLAGYVVDDSNSAALSSANIAGGALAPGEQAVLYNADDVTAGDFAAAWGTVNLIPVTSWSSLALNNGGDKVSLWDSFSSYTGDNVTHANAIDTVDYTGAGFPDPVGASIYLIDLGADNNVGANWAASTDGGATPLYTGRTSAAAGGNGGADVGSPGTPAVTKIHDVQGNGAASPLVGRTVVIEGIVVGDFQDGAAGANGDLNGFHVQEEDVDADSDALTSEGIFVFNGNSPAVNVEIGDLVRVEGVVSEFNGLTEITSFTGVSVLSSGNSLPTASVLSLPVAAVDDFEAYEGMYVTFPQALVISEYFNFDRFNEIVLTSKRHLTPTAAFEPGPDAVAAANAFLLDKITLDDGRTNQNPDPAIHPNGLPFNLSNLFRGGDTVANVTGVMDYAFGLYRIQPTQGANYTSVNPRMASPDPVGGNLTVASFNVLNYFSTLDNSGPICGPSQNQDCRGADNAGEFTRQRDKIIAALTKIDADVVGLLEIENNINDDAVIDLVNGLNAVNGADTYAYVDTGAIGTDAIKVALIYKPATVDLVGSYAILDSSVDSRFLDTKNRPTLAQTFIDNSSGGIFTVAVNHLKSKGSDCNDVGDPDTGDGAGNCNLTRKAAAEVLVDWLASDPTGSGDEDFLIIGDLNSYDKEDPIDVLVAGGYTDLVYAYHGEDAYSYVFDGQTGYLDYALASADLVGEVTGVTEWHINADEADLIDYDTSFKGPNQDAIYAPDAYRSSDHDPVIIGLDVCDKIAPVFDEASVTPDVLGKPNHMYVNVTATVVVSDNFDPNPTVTLLSVKSNEPDNGEDDGNTVNDIVIVDDFHFKLRAERSGVGAGRVYTITYQVTDACGNSAITSVTVRVPLSQSN